MSKYIARGILSAITLTGLYWLWQIPDEVKDDPILIPILGHHTNMLLRIGTMVGIILGGIVVVIGIGFGLYWCCKEAF